MSSHLASALAAEEEKLLACVHCGLCLEACPTYTLTGDENDGPRGRIYLMRAVEEGRLAAASTSFERHINRCLGCRACEQACPAGVEYGELLEASRELIYETTTGRRHGWTNRLLRFLLRRIWLHPSRLRFAFGCARAMRDAGLARLLLKSRLARLVSARAEFALAMLESSAPAKPLTKPRAPLKPEQPAKTEQASTRVVHDTNNDTNEAGRVAQRPRPTDSRALLFTGCVTEGLFARVNLATARVLAANGCASHAPPAQGCCGALHAHAGDLEGARRLARRNIEAFANSSDDKSEASGAASNSASDDESGAFIITNAGGCGAMLVSYAGLLADDALYGARAREFSARVRDISQQLAQTGIRQGAALDDSPTTYDASCHLLYGQRAGDAPLRMLEAIPNLNFAPLLESERCCGGAGVYNLLEPEMAGRVLDEKLARLKETKAERLATANPGCHMHLAAGARLKGMTPLRVCHPIELLDESYARAGFYKDSDE
ncbi:MAG: glycolate oxidase iron-sulfur subunit [Blastocatellia bacterium]|nr:glycolate oxidase iron-sulfur subunit [Blastocatellia bacterium]